MHKIFYDKNVVVNYADGETKTKKIVNKHQHFSSLKILLKECHQKGSTCLENVLTIYGDFAATFQRTKPVEFAAKELQLLEEVSYDVARRRVPRHDAALLHHAAARVRKIRPADSRCSSGDFVDIGRSIVSETSMKMVLFSLKHMI